MPVNDLESALALIAAIDERPAEALEGTADFGHYDGLPPRVELLDDGRLARLLAPIEYFRPDKSRWPVPDGVELDGASIPRAFWSVIGGPFEGRYRNASIVHDHYCVTQTRGWRDTHRMFHDAMRCSGVGAIKAKIMFYAVYRFGPRWEGLEEGAVDVAPLQPAPSDETAPSIAVDVQAIAAGDPSLAEVERMADAWGG